MRPGHSRGPRLMAGDWFDGAGAGQRLDVVKLMDSKVGDGIAALVDAGALVGIGLPSDGGALGLPVPVDGRWRRKSFRDEDTLIAWIAEAIPAVNTARGQDRP